MSPLAKPLLPITLLAVLAGIASAAEQSKKPLPPPAGVYQVAVTNGYVSVTADQAPLNQVLQEVGKQARIKIDSNIGPEEKITIRLDRVPLEDGIKQLAKNVSFVYAQGPKDKPRRIERVVVLSEVKERVPPQPKIPQKTEKSSEAAAPPAAVKKPSQPEPFKFEFDPSKSAEKKETPGKQP